MWIVFIEVNFTVAFLLIRKTWDDGFAGQVGEWGILRNGGDFEMGGEGGGGEVGTSLWAMPLMFFIFDVLEE